MTGPQPIELTRADESSLLAVCDEHVVEALDRLIGTAEVLAHHGEVEVCVHDPRSRSPCVGRLCFT